MPSMMATIPTLGDSCARLQWLLNGLRATSAEVRILIADDAGDFSSDKRRISECYGCEYVKNDGKPGIPGNLNSALKHCRADWILVIDDGSSVHFDWHKSAAAIAKAVSDRTFDGRKVALCGSSHIQDWMLRLSGLLDKWSIIEWFYRPHELGDAFQRYFREKVGCQHNIDWGMVAALWQAGPRERNDEWPAEIKDFLRYNVDGSTIVCDGVLEPDIEAEVCRAKYLWSNRWPHSAAPLRVNWSPGAQGLLINHEFLEECGGFSHDCMGYERLLACKAAERGWLSLASDYAPYMHIPSLGFVELVEKKIQPVHREIYDVCAEIWGEENREPYRVVRKFVSAADDARANAELLEATNDER